MLILLLPFTALSPVTNLTPNSSSLPLEEIPPIDPPLPISAIPLGSKLQSSHWDCVPSSVLCAHSNNSHELPSIRLQMKARAEKDPRDQA